MFKSEICDIDLNGEQRRGFFILGLAVDYHSAKCIAEFTSESSRIEIAWVRQPACPMQRLAGYVTPPVIDSRPSTVQPVHKSIIIAKCKQKTH